MANHLEDLAAEWLEYNGYFVRKSVLVGRLAHGGFAGELDVVGFHPGTGHLIHVECSLDAHNWATREERFAAKFARGRLYMPTLFAGFAGEGLPDQVALLQMGGRERETVGGARILLVSDFMEEMMAVLRAQSPLRNAVPSTFPLLRTVQLAAQPHAPRPSARCLVPPASSPI